MKNRKRNKYLLLLILLLGISVGYALLSTTLKINGTSTITKNTWSIYWDNVGDIDKTDTATVTTAAVVDPADNTQVNFGVTLNLPGDYYEFQVDAVNNGTVDAMVDILTTLVNGSPVSSLPSYIKYEIKYADGGEILPNHLLAKKNGDTATRERVKVRIEYLRSVTPDDVNDMPDDEPYVFDIDLTYKQADDTAEDPHRRQPEAFATDDWDLVQEEANRASVQTTVTDGKCGVYNVGDTREIDMGTFGTHTIRIAGCSTPAVCGTEGFSETTCGFVIEFADVLPSYVMGGNGLAINNGGWRDSELRPYLNTDIYNALPTEIKNSVIETNVISSHGTEDAANFETQDKLYVLDAHEVYEDADPTGLAAIDTAWNNTRQLDYYAQNNVSMPGNNIDKAVKGSANSWWLRTANATDRNTFAYVTQYGGFTFTSSAMNNDVSPAFRIR